MAYIVVWALVIGFFAGILIWLKIYFVKFYELFLEKKEELHRSKIKKRIEHFRKMGIDVDKEAYLLQNNDPNYRGSFIDLLRHLENKYSDYVPITKQIIDEMK